MEPKPKGWSETYGSMFRDQAVADVYHLRPPYPAETFAVLADLARRGPVSTSVAARATSRARSPRASRGSTRSTCRRR